MPASGWVTAICCITCMAGFLAATSSAATGLNACAWWLARRRLHASTEPWHTVPSLTGSRPMGISRHWRMAGLLCLALTGCTTAPPAADRAVPVPQDRIFAHGANGPQADLIVTRDSGAIGAGCKVGFFIDGKIAATLKPSETASFSLDRGTHLIGVGNDPNGAGLCAIHTMTLKEQAFTSPSPALRRWRISMDMNGGTFLTPTSG